MPRKPKKDAGLLERPKGSGRYSIRYRDQFGVQKTEVGGTITQAKALLARRRGEVEGLKAEARSKRLTMEALQREKERDGLTLSALVDRYQREFEQLKSARMVLGYLAEWARVFGGRHPALITSGDVRAWQVDRLAAGAKEGTVNRYVAYLRALFNKAIRDQLLDSNPCGHGRVPALREKGQRKRVITPEEEAALLGLLEPADAAAFTVCLYTGMRQGEALGLQRPAVDLVAGLAHLADTKAGKEASVRLNDVAKAALRFMLESHQGLWVFPNRRGNGPMNGKELTKRVQAAAEKLDLPKVWFHSLRHTYVTRLGDGRTDIGTAQELARHASVTQTRHYWHPSDERKQAAVDSLAVGFQGWDLFATEGRKGHLRIVE